MSTTAPPRAAVSRRARRTTVLQPLRTVARTALTAGVTALDRLVPKDPRLLVVGGDDGAAFTGNARVLFEHAVAAPGWEAYWFSTSRSVLSAVARRHPGRAVHAAGPRALLIGVRSRAALVTHSRRDVGLLGYSRLRRFVQLTHGVGPKTMGYAKREHDVAPLDRETSTYAHLTCSSAFEATFWERGYRMPPADLWVTGVPRNDALLAPADPALVREHPVLAGRTVLYAPTFRDQVLLEDYLPVPGMDGAALVELLERHDATLLLRPHPYEAGAARATVERVASPRVVAAGSDTFPDPVELLKHVDVLVTDYSSIYADFLLLDRPIVFTPVDLAEYEDERGFFFPYADHTPGPKAVTGPDLLAALEDALSGADPFAGQRARDRELFHAHPAGGACERILERLAREPMTRAGRRPRPRPRQQDA